MPMEQKGGERYESSRITRDELAHLLKAIMVQAPEWSPEALALLAKYREISNALRSSPPEPAPTPGTTK